MSYLIHGWIRAPQKTMGPKNRKIQTVQAEEIIAAEMDSPAERSLVRRKTANLRREIAEEIRGRPPGQYKFQVGFPHLLT